MQTSSTIPANKEGAAGQPMSFRVPLGYPAVALDQILLFVKNGGRLPSSHQQWKILNKPWRNRLLMIPLVQEEIAHETITETQECAQPQRITLGEKAAPIPSSPSSTLEKNTHQFEILKTKI